MRLPAPPLSTFTQGSIRPAWVVASICAALLGACASPGPDHPPLARTAPAALGLSAPASTPVASQWWSALGDARLDQLVDQALKDQPGLAVARARLARARALTDNSRATQFPQGALDVNITRQRYTENGLYPPPYAGNVWNSGFLQAGLNWSPDFFGQHAAELTAALGRERAAQAEAASAANTLAAQVSRSYVALARLLAQRDVMQSVLRQRNDILALTRERQTAGLDTRVELTQAEGAVPDARAQIEALDEQIALARHLTAVLTGQAPDALDTLAPRLDALRLDQLPVALGADLLGRRPDVVAARWRVEASTQDVAQARAQFYPNINLSAFMGLSTLGLGPMFDPGSRQIGISPALHLPLFDGGRLRAQLGGRQAELDEAIAQYNGALLDAVREAGDAISSTRSIERQQGEQAQALSSAETAYSLALQRFQAGLNSYLSVLSAENQLLAQRHLAVDLQGRQLDTRVALMKALGGGWTDDTATVSAAAQRLPDAPTN
jgi:NodT family efflux transporter outer membrane factor (OMF) lipoprotein